MLARYNRLFASDGHCVDVAVDHGLAGAVVPAAASESVRKVIGALVDAGPDAVQLSPGQAPLLQLHPGPDKPALVMRADVTNAHSARAPGFLYSELVDDAVGRAVRMDAACVVADLIRAPDEPRLEQACLRNVSRLKADCEPAGMPLMVASLVTAPGNALEDTARLVRQAVELGADIVAVAATGDVGEYRRVVEMASDRPVLARVEGPQSEEELLRRVEELMRQGAAGIVDASDLTKSAATTQALMAVVHAGMTADDALLALDA
ncbi:MAG: aldolase [Thermoleophilaceae bacterium]|nr:aldolase [Thermoleophilaceae bacterium]